MRLLDRLLRRREPDTDEVDEDSIQVGFARPTGWPDDDDRPPIGTRIGSTAWDGWGNQLGL